MQTIEENDTVHRMMTARIIGNGTYAEQAAREVWRFLSKDERKEFFSDEAAFLAYWKAAAEGKVRHSRMA